jgi:Glycosyltransferase family 17
MSNLILLLYAVTFCVLYEISLQRFPTLGVDHVLLDIRSLEDSTIPWKNFKSQSFIVFDADNAIPMNNPKEIHVRRTFKIDEIFQKIYEEIDEEDESIRCQRYGFSFRKGSKRRRIFLGALVASETIDVLQIHAAEAYNVYHTVALIESNTTFRQTPRELRYTPGTPLHRLLKSGIFGNETNVFVDLWWKKARDARGMVRESLQRESILYRWKQQGMSPQDIGIVGDIDEFFSRDFLRAAQICDIPEFKVNDCRNPKIAALSTTYESSPYCQREQKWYHPDMILGSCIEGIGDSSGRISPIREYHRRHGSRIESHGGGESHEYRQEYATLKRYPLWTPQDFREAGDKTRQQTWVDRRWSVGYHLHNFLDGSFESVRNKYATYGHGKYGVDKLPLSRIANDLDLVVRCVHNLSNDANPSMPARVEKPFHEFEGPQPIFFVNVTYCQCRHTHLQNLIRQDELKFGSVYKNISRGETI